MVHRSAHGPVEALRVGRFELGWNTTVFVYRLGSTLIDAGMSHARRPVVAFARERAVDRVLLTHHHEDHSGNAAAIAAATGAPVYGHVAGLPALARGVRLRPYQRVLFGRPPRVAARPLPEALDAGGGFELRVLPAPGHAPDLVCYLEPREGWLFTGDLYVGSRPRYLRADEDLDLQLASLRSVLAQDFGALCCGHRGLVVDGRRALEEKLAYLEELRGRAVELQRRGLPPAAIARELLGREDLTSYATGLQFTKGNLIRACLNGAGSRPPGGGA